MNIDDTACNHISCRRTEYVTLNWVEPVEGYSMFQIRSLLNRGAAELHSENGENSIRLTGGATIATFKEIETTAEGATYNDFQLHG